MKIFFSILLFILVYFNGLSQSKIQILSMEQEYFDSSKKGNDCFGYTVKDEGINISYIASTKGYYYAVNKRRISTKKNFHLKSISFYKLIPLGVNKNLYYGLTSIDTYTDKSNRNLWTYVVFKINKKTKAFIAIAEKNYYSDGIKIANFDKFNF